MLKPKCRYLCFKQESLIDTKQEILKKARKLFAKHGFEGASIRNICEQVECNVSAISYHFGSKEELYKACLCEGGYNIIQMMEGILTTPENASDFKAKLRLFQIQFFEYAINNRDLFVMITKDINSKSGMETIHKFFHKVPETMTAFFQKGIDKGVLKKEVDPIVLGDLVTQPLFMQILFAEANKQMKNKNVADAKYRQHFVDQQMQILLDSILN